MLSKLKATTKNSFIYSLGNMAGKLSGIILLPIYAKYLSIEEFGLLSLYEVIFQLLSIFATFGQKSSLMRFYWDAEYRKENKSIVFNSFLIIIILSVVFLTLSGLILNTFSLLIFDVSVSPRLNLIFILSTFIRVISEFIFLLQRIQQKAMKQTIYQLIALVFVVFLTWFFIKYLNLNIEGVFLALTISHCIVVMLLVPYVFRNINTKINVHYLKEGIKYGAPLSVASLLTIVLVLSDRFILNHFMDLNVVGNYSLAYKITNIINMIVITSFMNSYTHIFYKEMNQEDSGRFYSKILTYFTVVIVFMSMLLVVFSKEIIKVLSKSNSDYWDSIELIPYLIIGIIIAGIRQIITLPLTKEKKTKIISTISIAASFLNVGLNFILIPKCGAIGAAIATIFAQLFAMLYLYFVGQKHSNISYEILKIAKCFLVAVPITAISFFMDDFDLFLRLTSKTVVVLFFFVILYYVRFFEPIEIQNIKGLIRKWSNISNLASNVKKEL